MNSPSLSISDLSSSGPPEIGVLDAMLSHAERARRQSSPVSAIPNLGIFVGALVAIRADGVPLVRWRRGAVESTHSARSTVPLDEQQVGSDVVLVFPDGEQDQTIILGVIATPVNTGAPETSPLHATVDGERLELTAEREIVLSCGKASITLTRAGKVLIRGEYVLTQSSGVHRIKGGSVQIN